MPMRPCVSPRQQIQRGGPAVVGRDVLVQKGPSLLVNRVLTSLLLWYFGR